MVAKITSPHSILRVLNYNEKKVQKGVAKCIYAGNFLADAKELQFYDKLYVFKHRVELNQRAKTNMLHLSLNFHPSEKISSDKLIAICSDYMSKIGFGNQPFLIYEHKDAGHPHVHIVTTSILPDGKRIDTFNIGRNQSEKARQEIEKEYRLVKAEGRLLENDAQQPSLKRMQYGSTETKRSMVNILERVLIDYKYTSLIELNVLLKLFNIVADPGMIGSRISRNKGLTYRILDNRGNKTGVPIKASSIYFKPTLSFLEIKFAQNKNNREPFRQKLKTAIDWGLQSYNASINELSEALKNEKINVILRKNDKGFIYGITFIDHRTKCVFNGSDLGKAYSAAGIQKRLLPNTRSVSTGAKNKLFFNNEKKDVTYFERSKDTSKNKDRLIQLLLNHEQNDSRFPIDFLKKKKKKRKKNN